jgi:hypothetical protein
VLVMGLVMGLIEKFSSSALSILFLGKRKQISYL